MAISDADLSLLESINRFAARHDGWEDAARFYASASEVLFLAGLLLLALAGIVLKRRAAVVGAAMAGGSAALALAVSKVIGTLVNRPRPFVAHHQIHSFLPHAADASFPSEHAAAAFAIAASLTLSFGVRALPVLVAAAALAVARVVVGVHYPSDVLIGALIGIAAAVVVSLFVYRFGPRWANRAAHAALRALRRARPAPPGEPQKVAILMMSAWGMGGTIRTSLNLAGYLVRDREVEVLSMVRRRSDPFFEVPPGVTLVALDDQRPRENRGLRGLWRKALRACPSVLVHPSDKAYRACSLLSDIELLRHVWNGPATTFIGTRPALNLLALDLARPGDRAVGEEHMHLGAHPPPLRAEIARRYGGLDALVGLTDGDLRAYRELLGEDTRLETIPNAVPAMKGSPAALESPVVLAAGRLNWQKGFGRLISAFALIADSHPGWTLRICGSGPKKAELEQMVATLGLTGRVELPGRARDMAAEMEAASLFVMSSRFEGFPMVLIEAMSKGLPIVSFDCPTGPREVLDGGRAGVLVKNGDLDALGEAMAALMDDPDERRRLGDAALAESEKYRLDAIGPRWQRLLDTIAPRTRRGAVRPAGPQGNGPPARHPAAR